MENKMGIIGKKFKADFGDYAFELHFESETQLTWTSLADSNLGDTETIQMTRTEIRPNLYMVYWKEKSGTRVTHVQDFENNTVYTNIADAGHHFLNLKGTLTPL
ncbi:MAG: MoaF-related domain-containing protein [Bacteroidia bacterium]